MKKILIVGSAPLPFENKNITYSSGVRTWQIIKPIIEKKNLFKTDAFLISPFYQDANKKPPQTKIDSVNINYLTFPEALQDKHLSAPKINNYDAVISINIQPSYLIAQKSPEVPFWADVNGYIITKRKSFQFERRDFNLLVPPFYENNVLKKADKISSATISQKYCITGKLSLLEKRLTPKNHQELLEYIPNAVFAKEKTANPPKRSLLLKKSYFNIFWCSGFNQWTDYKTLYRGLKKAMDENPRIKFFSTQMQPYSETSIQLRNFQKMIQAGPHSEKFYFLSNLSNEELASFLKYCDLGLVCDKSNHETIIGARTMTGEMIRQGLPLILSRSTELSQTIEENNLYPVFSPGDNQKLTEEILQAAKNPKEYRSRATKSYEFLLEKYNPEKTTENLIKWLKNPYKKQRA
ncbi:MAG: hypothetical protein ACOCUF_00300 [Patescibacteria group bacterium]